MFEQDEKYQELYREIRDKQQELVTYLKNKPSKKVDDYILKNPDGEEIKLSELFGDKQELILVHNMGKSCPYCNLWAHGFIGLVPHFQDRAAFALVSPDPPEVQKEVIKERGYNFPMFSADGTTFVSDMGFYDEENNNNMPGFSVFVKNDQGEITRTSKDFFGPFDPYNSVWHMFDLLPDGVNKWNPKIKY
ncbi:MAG: hypothetical protein HeimC3_21060 [Candidatus Heimdallarchaeota archaeon LC_3]|nr:MAG: hypothetical protein HeimC3_21060 [Candidatus Heimdallarchaeota archaeon LC_3]